MRNSFTEHITEEPIEGYALGRLHESGLAYREEHWSVCQECRAGINSTDAFVNAMRRAAREFNV